MTPIRSNSRLMASKATASAELRNFSGEDRRICHLHSLAAAVQHIGYEQVRVAQLRIWSLMAD